jgi:hypothetical protein
MSPLSTADFTSIFGVATIQPPALPTLCAGWSSITLEFKCSRLH